MPAAPSLPILLLMLALLLGAAVFLWAVAIVLALVAAGLFLLGLILMVIPRLRRVDPYDLGRLKDVHERAEWQDALDAEVDPDADITCPHCQTVYGQVLPACPRCGRSPY